MALEPKTVMIMPPRHTGHMTRKAIVLSWSWGGSGDFLAEICCEALLHLQLCAIASLPVCDSRCSWLVDHRSGQAIAFDVWGSYVRPICKREGGGGGERQGEGENSTALQMCEAQAQ